MAKKPKKASANDPKPASTPCCGGKPAPVAPPAEAPKKPEATPGQNPPAQS